MNISEICLKSDLFDNRDGIVRVPFLVKGTLVLPPDIERQQILAAFQNCSPEANYMKLPDVQVVREPVIDRTTMRYTGDYLYQVMPPVAAAALIEPDIDKLVAGPFSLKTKDILDYLDVIIKALSDNQAFITRVMDIYRLTSDFPDDYLDSWATLLLNLSRREHARQMTAELGAVGDRAARSMSPVDEVRRCRTPTRCAPPGYLPAPCRPQQQEVHARWRPLQEAFVGAHHHLRLHLSHRVERDADGDQDRGASERARSPARSPRSG